MDSADAYINVTVYGARVLAFAGTPPTLTHKSHVLAREGILGTLGRTGRGKVTAATP